MDKKNKVNERLGFCGVNHQGSKFRVIYYKNNINVWVEFYDHIKEQITIVKTTWQHIESKNIMDAYQPSVYNNGYLGKSNSRDKEGKQKKSYDKWVSMLARCYDSKFHLKQPTYKGCSVCEEWKCFENFERDYEILLKENNFSEDTKLDLDKDILFKGNKIYSKENCILVPKKVNNLFTKSNKKRGGLPIGVSYCKNNKNPYVAQVGTGIKTPNNKTPYILVKRFPTPEEAFYWYKDQKEQVIKSVAMDYLERGFITEESRLFKALMSYKVDIND